MVIPKPKNVLEDLDLKNLDIPLPNYKKPYPFQEDLIKAMLEFYKRGMKGVYNGSDMGLGKSFMAIAISNILKTKRHVVVCPSNLRGSWEQEIREFSTISPLGVRTIYGHRDALNPINSPWTIVSYRMLLNKKVFDRLIERPIDFLIIDEAQNIKSTKAKQTILVKELWNRSRKGKLMSGTPILRSTTDLFVPLNMLMPEKFYDFIDFAEEYALKRYVPWGRGEEYFDGKNLDELSQILRSNFFVRKKKEEVLKDLPEKTYQLITLDCGKLENEISEVDAKLLIECIDKGEDPSKKFPQEKKHVSALRQEAAIAKIKEGKEFTANILESGESLVLYAYHTSVINALMQVFEKYTPLKLDGSTPAKKKQEVVDCFNSKKGSLLIAQLQCVVGLNLQHNCSKCIFFETTYSPSEINQAVDRFLRIGQKWPVHAYFLGAKDSVDDKVMEILISKQSMIEQVIQST